MYPDDPSFYLVGPFINAGMVFSVVYFCGLFLGLTVWRDKIVRPRLFTWAAGLFAAVIVIPALAIPLMMVSELQSSSAYQSRNEIMGIGSTLIGISCVVGFAASVTCFFGALVPKFNPPTLTPSKSGDPVKNPWDG